MTMPADESDARATPMPTDIPTPPKPPLDEAEMRRRAALRKLAQTGEAERGLWQRVTFRRAVAEGVAIFVLWRLLVLVPITFWPGSIFPLILVALLALRILPPVWASVRIIATKREKLSRRFFALAGMLAGGCALADAAIALAVGDPMQPFGGPTFGPDIARFGATAHHLAVGDFALAEVTTLGLLLAYYVLAVICTRLAQGGFLRFTMPAGDGRITL